MRSSITLNPMFNVRVSVATLTLLPCYLREVQELKTPILLNCGFLRNNPSTVQARKRPIRVAVRFCLEPTVVATREGPVAAVPGDAILTDASGNCWPVGARRFAGKYRPISAVVQGEDGFYEALPVEVHAAPAPFAFVARTRDGGDLLHGIPGDWLVDYQDGSLGVVADSIFRETYEVMTK